MPAIRSARNRKPPPEGFDDIEDTLLEFSNKMKDAENASHEGKRRAEVLWPVFQITHQRSRYIYDLYYEKEAISKTLYDWLLKNGYADANLIAKWKKQGYEKGGLPAKSSSRPTGAFGITTFLVDLDLSSQSIQSVSASPTNQNHLTQSFKTSLSSPGDINCQAAKLFAFAHFFRRASQSSISIPLRRAVRLPLIAGAVLAPESPSSSTPFLSTLHKRGMHSKLVIIGSGPAAHTAAIYAARAELKPVLYEGFLANDIAAGGQLTTTEDVENYPGFQMIRGPELMDKMRAQSEACGTEIVTQTVSRVDLSKRPFKYRLYEMGSNEDEEAETHTADSLILATGAAARRLHLPGEDKYWQNGVSACAVCDGGAPIFSKKPLVVIGGGDSAVEESLYLTKKASHVTVLVRRHELRASRINARRLSTNPKISIKYNTVATEIKGEEKDRGLMTHLRVKNIKTGEEETLQANGLFYAVGHEPATRIFKGQIDMDEDGYIVTKPGMSYTSVEGVFAAGDVQDKRYRQAITSAGSGCVAALEAEKWIAEQEADALGTNPLELVDEVKKANGVVPEYRSNPLL